jgi:F0F1-type ATP synthase membrane subunit a
MILTCATLLRATDLFSLLLTRHYSTLACSSPLASTTLTLIPFSVLELLSTVFRSLSLGLRFTSNLTAGHVMLHTLSAGTSLTDPLTILARY